MLDDKKHFFQFPIGAIYTGKPVNMVEPELATEMIERIYDHCVVTLAQRFSESEAPDDFGFKDVERAVRALGLCWDDLESYWLELDQDNLIYRSKGTSQVRVDGRILREVEDGAFEWKDFSYLCAVYCGIGYAGGKSRKCLRVEHLSALATGFNSEELRKNATDSTPALSRHTARRIIKNLQRRGFFAQTCADGRNVYYSRTQSQQELEQSIVRACVEKKVRASSVKEMRARIDAEVNRLTGAARCRN